MVGIIAAFTESPATDMCRQKVQAALIPRFFEITAELERAPLTDAERFISEQGSKACAMQPTTDQLDLTASMAKAQYLGPGTTLIEQGIKDRELSSKNMQCLDFYFALHKTGPVFRN